jgi:fluoride exporter
MINFVSVLTVGLGGFIGSVLRYAISLTITQRINSVFPYGTFLVNIIGSFVIGVIIGASLKTNLNENLRLFLATGICGGFTTFSAFAGENFRMFHENMAVTAFIYIATSLVFGLLAVGVGVMLGKSIF